MGWFLRRGNWLLTGKAAAMESNLFDGMEWCCGRGLVPSHNPQQRQINPARSAGMKTNQTARLGAAIERAGRAALQQLSSPPSIKQMSLLSLMRERRKSWLVELRAPLHKNLWFLITGRPSSLHCSIWFINSSNFSIWLGRPQQLNHQTNLSSH